MFAGMARHAHQSYLDLLIAEQVGLLGKSRLRARLAFPGIVVAATGRQDFARAPCAQMFKPPGKAFYRNSAEAWAECQMRGKV